ncbi:MAG: prenyltransferase/squalene oxidase repeat-containing protein [Planctomycetaceae bacterium]|jgi:geranylgeranyl transferase type-2 subunit beta
MYLFALADRVARGLRKIESNRLERHRGFLMTQQLADGGFRGREGDSDLYYTGFAVRGLAISGGLDMSQQDSISCFLGDQNPLQLNVIDQLSWLYSALVIQASGGRDLLEDQPADFIDRVAGRLESLRTADGGYAKSSEGKAGSTYHSFLAVLTWQMLGRSVPRPNALIQFLYDRQRDDGGFVEIAPMKRSGTNPTAAAVALLHDLGALDADIVADVLGFLTDVASSEGGFQANTRIPFADGLSTFTGLLTAQDLGRPDLLPAGRIEEFVSGALECTDGGFMGASWDQQPDAEYTFYGLGILGLLNAAR